MKHLYPYTAKHRDYVVARRFFTLLWQLGIALDSPIDISLWTSKVRIYDQGVREYVERGRKMHT